MFCSETILVPICWLSMTAQHIYSHISYLEVMVKKLKLYIKFAGINEK